MTFWSSLKMLPGSYGMSCNNYLRTHLLQGSSSVWSISANRLRACLMYVEDSGLSLSLSIDRFCDQPVYLRNSVASLSTIFVLCLTYHFWEEWAVYCSYVGWRQLYCLLDLWLDSWIMNHFIFQAQMSLQQYFRLAIDALRRASASGIP